MKNTSKKTNVVFLFFMFLGLMFLIQMFQMESTLWLQIIEIILIIIISILILIAIWSHNDFYESIDNIVYQNNILINEYNNKYKTINILQDNLIESRCKIKILKPLYKLYVKILYGSTDQVD